MRNFTVFFLAALFGVTTLRAAGPKFLIVSDLGDFGSIDQTIVANAIGREAADFRPDAIINLGDTFHYWGVQSTDDPGWQSNFETVYTEPALHNLWYCALGNHDYQGNTQALIDYTDKSRRWNLPAHYYTKTFRRGDTSVEFIFIDSSPFLSRISSQPDIYPDAAHQDLEAQTLWLAERLAGSDADWVIVAAHHPLFSSRPDTSRQRADAQSALGEIIGTCPPDVYLAGDVHCFEHFKRPDIATDFITCTSGSHAYPVVAADDAIFTSGDPGFMTLTADKHNLTFRMVNSDGETIYEYTKTK